MITKDELKAKYIDWLKKEITIDDIECNNTFEITTPFLDRFNDYIQIYVTILGDNEVKISDGQYVISNLKSSGVDIKTDKREAILLSILKRNGVFKNKDELYVISNLVDFPQKKLNLIQTMINIDDMFMLTSNIVASLFLEDIKLFFDSKEIYYTDNINIQGKSGFNYSYDFILQRSKNKPERVCKAINNGTKSNMENTLFSWYDTKENRNKDSKLIVLLNDKNNIENGVIEGFKQYDVEVIKWSERNDEKVTKLLSA